MSTKHALIVAFGLGVGFAGSANAQRVATGLCSDIPCHITVQTANQGSEQCGKTCLSRAFDALPNAPGFHSAGAITAEFDYLDTSGLNLFTVPAETQSTDSSGRAVLQLSGLDKNGDIFRGTISNYSGHGTLMFPSSAIYDDVEHFLFSSASGGKSRCEDPNDPNTCPDDNNEFQYGSFITIETNTGVQPVLGAGPAAFVPGRSYLCILHDDGMSVYYRPNTPDGKSTRVGKTITGPTTQINEIVQLPNSEPFELGLLGGDLKLYYSRQNGAPSLLVVKIKKNASDCTTGR